MSPFFRLNNLIIAIIISAKATVAYDCPHYEAIKQQSVSYYRAAELDGGPEHIWYMAATNEPTLPPICTCGVNNITVSDDQLSYSYTNTDICTGLKQPFVISIGGEIDPENPGNMKENAIIHGHQLKNLDPNMVFHIERNSDGAIDVVYTYACLGHGLFSFNVLTRTPDYSTEEIEDRISAIDELVPDTFKLEKMRITNSTMYADCGL